MSINTTSATDAPNPASAMTAAFTEPVAKAGRDMYNQVAGGAQWYLEQLEDLVHEAKASRAEARGQQGVSVPDVLAGLSEAKVASSIPGRVRLRLRSLKGQDQLAEQVTQALAGIPGISQAAISPHTCGVLISYDTTQFASLDALLQAIKPPQA
jgi:hypothetical protein